MFEGIGGRSKAKVEDNKWTFCIVCVCRVGKALWENTAPQGQGNDELFIINLINKQPDRARQNIFFFGVTWAPTIPLPLQLLSCFPVLLSLALTLSLYWLLTVQQPYFSQMFQKLCWTFRITGTWWNWDHSEGMEPASFFPRGIIDRAVTLENLLWWGVPPVSRIGNCFTSTSKTDLCLGYCLAHTA